MRRIIAAVIILLSALLLFTRLGHYALWDDEAVTALAARGVWKTGDTSVMLDHNVVAYRGGLLLSGTKERSTPPLGAYLAAPFVGLSNGEPWIVRLPFALLGLASVGLIIWWLYRADASWLTWVLVGMAIIGNVSLWLYSRQCRYYSPAIFSSIAIAYLYLNWNGSRWQLVLLAAASIMLLGSNYLNYVALQVCMLLDYVLAGRKRRVLEVKDWLIVLLPQVIIGGVIVLIWNTLRTGNVGYIQGNTFGNRLLLVFMNLRDINACEYGALLLILAAPLLFIFDRGQSWLWRAPLVLFIYIIIISMLSPQTLQGDQPWNLDADVRYLAPLIPLCIAIGVLAVMQAGRVHPALAIGIAVVAFGTNFLHGQWMADLIHDPRPVRTPLRSTLISYAGELSNPPTDPHTPTIVWIRQNVLDKQSIWVIPDYMTYPLLYHAPKPTYAWQLDPKNNDKLPEAIKGLPPIHFQGRAMPDFIISYGPFFDEAVRNLRKLGFNYQLVEIKDVYPMQTYRPELFWHKFTAQPADRNTGGAVYILKYMPLSAPELKL